MLSGPRAREHDSNNTMIKSNGQRAACDRCRGQKLKCSWALGEPQCKRCQRADVVCTVPQPRPMGRPSRQHSRSGSTRDHRNMDRGGEGDRERERENLAYNWSDGISHAGVSGDEDTSINMDPPTFAPPDSLDLLPWFPDSDGFNLFAPGGLAVATPPTMDPNLNLDANRVTSPQNDIPISMLMASASVMQSEPMQVLGMAVNDPGSAETRANEQTQVLTRLCNLNIALIQHPLSRDNSPSVSSQPAAPGGDSPTRTPAPERLPENNTSSSSSSSSSLHLSLAELGVGRLLQMTYELKEIMPRIWQTDPERHDRSTALLVLSCYTRLEMLYTRTLEILLAVRKGEQQLRDMHLLTPGLSVDGFSLGRCADLQLHFVIQLYQQTQERIRSCIKSGNGLLVAR